MCLTHTLIASSTVLQVVLVSIAHKVLPLDCHLRSVHGVVVLGIEVCSVILVVNAAHILQDLCVWFEVALIVCKFQPDLRECAVRLEARKDKCVVTQRIGHLLGSLLCYRGSYRTIEGIVGFLNEPMGVWIGEHICGVPPLLV